MDRAFNGPVLVGSPDGGMDIEEVAEKTPERIFTMPIDIIDGINIDQAMEMAANLNFTGLGQVLFLSCTPNAIASSHVCFDPSLQVWECGIASR